MCLLGVKSAAETERRMGGDGGESDGELNQ